MRNNLLCSAIEKKSTVRIFRSKFENRLESYMAEKDRDVIDLVGATDYIDFKELGYEGDPIITGGRFTKLPLGKR